MEANPTVRVILVDDHQVVREGYRRLFENTSDIAVIAEADSGEAAVERYLELRPDVLVMDLSMPGIGGLEACRQIIARDARAQILIFSMFENAQHFERALNTGVKGYISKHSASQEMLDAVRAVAAGRTYIGQELTQALLARSTRAGKQGMQLLSPREYEVFRQLAEGHTVNEVASMLSLSPKTVGHHYANIRKKLAINTPTELVRLAIENGVIPLR